MVNLTIDGRHVEIEESKTVLEAAAKVGIHIPALCHHQEVSSYGACRLCQVEVTKGRKSRLVASCLYPVAEGLEVKTSSDRITRNRRLIVELLLARCPEVKALQKLAEEYGVGRPRFKVYHDDCILCGLCVRVCDEVLGAKALSFAGRGTSRRVEVPFDEPPETCLGCGACTYVCPTGAIQMETEARNRWRKTQNGQSRECRYARMGIISYKICPNSFQCQECEVDQMLEDKFGIHPAFAIRPARAREPVKVDMFSLLPNLYYSKGHVWAKRLNGKVRIGLDDFARRFIGNITDIRLAGLDNEIKQNEVLWELTSNKRKLAMLAPITGRLVDINPLVLSSPSVIAEDSYNQGWIFTVEPSDPEQELSVLLYGPQAQELLKTHSEILHQKVDEELGVTMTDGSGDLIKDLPARIDDKEWENLVREFFLVNQE